LLVIDFEADGKHDNRGNWAPKSIEPPLRQASSVSIGIDFWHEKGCLRKMKFVEPYQPWDEEAMGGPAATIILPDR
jgi:hypothetical protein